MLTLGTFVTISVLIFRDPGFPLGLGLIQTRGMTGLLVTIPSVVVGIAGLILSLAHRPIGMSLLLVYSAFWAVQFWASLLTSIPAIIRRQLVVCASGTCNSLPVLLGIVIAFTICSVSFARVKRSTHES